METNEEKVDWREEAVKRNSIPKALREPVSEQEFCKNLNLAPSTYYWFLSSKEAQEKILTLCLHNVKKRTPEVLEKLGEMAEAGDSASIQMFLKFILELAEKTKTEINIGEEDRKSIKEIIDELKRNNESPVPELLQGRPEQAV